jgi:hypothetical protein
MNKNNFWHSAAKYIGGSLLTIAACALFAAPQVHAVAGDGASSTIELADGVGEGFVTGMTFQVANPNGETWSLSGALPYGFSVTYDGNDVDISSVSITSAADANPVLINIELDTLDLDYPFVEQNQELFELIYTQGNAGSNCTVQDCLTDDTDEELNAIATGDTGPTDTEDDVIAPQINAGTSKYYDDNADGKVDYVSIQFTETVSVTMAGGDWSFSTPGDVNLTGDFAASECTLTASIQLDCIDVGDGTFDADANKTGKQSSGGANPVWAYNDASGNIADGNGNILASTNINLDDGAVALVRLTAGNTLDPLNGETDVPVDETPIFTFTEYMNTGTLSLTNTNAPSGGYTAAWSSNDTVLTLNHASDFAGGTAVTIVLTTAEPAEGDASGTIGTIGTGRQSLSFTTVATGGGSSFGPGEGYNVNGTLKINEGATETGSREVTLNITGSVNSAEMVVADNPNFHGATWQKVKDMSFTLSEGLGEKTVYMRLRDKGHLSPVYTAKIKLVEKTETTKTTEKSEEKKDEKTEDKKEETQQGVTLPKLPASMQIGNLVKIDGNTAVYYIGADHKRHAFPNQKVYESYYADFSQVKTVSADDLASVGLGANMKLRAGTWLMKITSDPKVYAVEPNGTLRWVKTETVAKSLYGENWNKKIIDIGVALFSDYTVGNPIELVKYPNGAIYKNVGGQKFYVENQKARKITGAGFAGNLFQEKFVQQAKAGYNMDSGSELMKKEEAIALFAK